VYRGNYSTSKRLAPPSWHKIKPCSCASQREVKHIESFIARFRAQASKSTSGAKSHQSIGTHASASRRRMSIPNSRFSFLKPAKLPAPLLAIEDQSGGYGQQVTIGKVNFTIAPGDRIALLGHNGAGKST